MTSYERYEAGAEHELVLLLKGFEDEPLLKRSLLERAAGSGPSTLEIPDSGSDVTSYRHAAGRLEHRQLCFLNSFSELGAAGWLAHLVSAAQPADVGAAGATGSWGSHLSYNAFQAGLGGAYARAFPSRRDARRAMHERSGTIEGGAPAEMAHAALQALRDVTAMPRFPAAHLRTNALLIDRERFAGLRFGTAGDKRTAYRFESGRTGLTAQLRAAGQRVVVVDRDGRVHPEATWDRADVFWQADQAKLLVHDNQTRAYAAATPQVQRVLSAFAWGAGARPGAPQATV